MSLQSRAAVLFRHQWLKGCIMWGGSLTGIRCIGGVRGVRRYNRHRRYIMEHRGSGQISCRHWTTATGIIERRNDFSREQPYPRRAALLTTLWGREGSEPDPNPGPQTTFWSYLYMFLHSTGRSCLPIFFKFCKNIPPCNSLMAKRI